MASSDPAISLEPDQYKGWPAWRIQRGPLELLLVPQVGGRIMGIRWRGQELLFSQPERQGQVLPSELRRGDVAAAKRAMGFPLWGGDKTWLAPQAHWNDGTPFLDLDSGPYGFDVEAARPDLARVAMISPVCRETGVRVKRTVVVPATEPSWAVVHRMENAGPGPVEWALWDVCMVLRPARVLLPRWATSAYPDGVKTYAEEGDSAAARARVVHALRDRVEVQCRESIEFKYGVDPAEGWVAAELQHGEAGPIVYRKSVPVFSDRRYAHGCVAEVYNSAAYPYFEMELHGPLVRLQPGESFELEERQSISEARQA